MEVAAVDAAHTAGHVGERFLFRDGDDDDMEVVRKLFVDPPTWISASLGSAPGS
jgi:hypothetical protein